MDTLEELKKIFLSADVDSETYEENLQKITEWEKELIDSENFLSWQEHETTRLIVSKARETYKDAAVQLASDRKMSEQTRQSLWAQQDACLLLISWASGDPKKVIEEVKGMAAYALETQ